MSWFTRLAAGPIKCPSQEKPRRRRKGTRFRSETLETSQTCDDFSSTDKTKAWLRTPRSVMERECIITARGPGGAPLYAIDPELREQVRPAVVSLGGRYTLGPKEPAPCQLHRRKDGTSWQLVDEKGQLVPTDEFGLLWRQNDDGGFTPYTEAER